MSTNILCIVSVSEEYQYLDDESLALVTKVGMATTHFSTIGVYHYRVAESPDSLNTCSVIVNPGPKVRNYLALLLLRSLSGFEVTLTFCFKAVLVGCLAGKNLYFGIVFQSSLSD